MEVARGVIHELSERVAALEARARRIDDMSRLGKLVYRVSVWIGAFLFSASTVWSLWMDHWGWWWHK